MYERAERLGMTVAQMSVEMPYAELVAWQALDQVRQAEAEKAQRMAGKGMRGR